MARRICFSFFCFFSLLWAACAIAQPLPRPEQLHPSLVLPYASGSLPAVVAANAGRLARVTDDERSLWMQTGIQWFNVSGVANVKAFDAVGDGVADDTAEIQAALNAASVVYIPDGTYLVSTTLSVSSNHLIYGGKNSVVKLADGSDTAVFSVPAGASRIHFSNFVIDGNKANQANPCATCRGIIVNQSGAEHITIDNVHIRNTGDDAILVQGANFVTIRGNHMQSVVTGIVIGGSLTSQEIVITDNVLEEIEGTAIGVTLTNGAIVTGNAIYDASRTLGQQAIVVGYDDEVTNVTVSNNIVDTTTAHGCFRAGGDYHIIEGNQFINCGERGITIITSNNPAERSTHIMIRNNYISGLTGLAGTGTDHGMHLARCDDCEVTGNHVIMPDAFLEAALYVFDGTNINISSNIFEEGQYGIRVEGTTDAVISSNRVSGTSSFGIYLADSATPVQSANILVIGNLLSGLDAASAGMDFDADSIEQLAVVGNYVSDAVALGEFRALTGTYVSGNYIAALSCSIASAASVDPNGRFIGCDRLQVTGTTNIDTLVSRPEGSRLTLVFSGVLTANDGTGNLELAGNFTTTANDTLTLISNGTTWYEVARSVN